MEYTRIEQENEVILTYRPAEDIQPVILRYERDLPERMRPQEPKAEPSPLPTAEPVREKVYAAEALQTPAKRKRNVLACLLTTLCFLLAVGCVGAGIWWIADDVSFMLSYGEIAPEPSGGSNGNSGNHSDGSAPEVPDGEYRSDEDRPEGETTIEAYRPEKDMTGEFKLVSVPAGTTPLTAGEVYKKMFPSTVTILGITEDSYSVGTGIIFTSDGYIMTNYHVIAGCSECEVWITNIHGVDTTYSARLVGGDEKQDLAILKVEAEGLTPAEFGVSSDLKVGDKVYAIGNPLGLELRSTFTDGIVSYVDRSVEVDGFTMTLLQTNAALNSGNSGGPLVNQYGQVVGINTIKMMSGYDTIEGLGFAIPTSIAERWIHDILTIGEIRPQPVLGLMINRIPVRLDDGTIGLEVAEVTPGLSGFKAGVQAGDFVVAFNGVTVTTIDEIYAQRHKLSVGDKVSIRVFRDGEYLDLTMVMMASPD